MHKQDASAGDVVGDDGIPRHLKLRWRKPARDPNTTIPFPHLSRANRPPPVAPPEVKTARATRRAFEEFVTTSGRVRTRRRWRRQGRR